MTRFLRLESRGVILAVAIAMFMVQLDATMLVVALPSIAAEFGVPAVSLSLSITIYLTMLVALLPVSGWAADRFGARRIFTVAIIGFAAASLLCALCESFWPFIAARALEGAAASLLTPVGRLILLKRTPKQELVDALSITAMPMLVAPTIGPLIGGFNAEHGRWEYIFLFNLPIAALLLWITHRNVPRFAVEERRRLDWVGAVLFAVALVTLLSGLDRLASDFTEPMSLLIVACGALLAWATWRHLRRHPEPIVSLDPLRVPGFATTAIGAGAVIRLPARALLFIAPLMFQIGFGMSPLAAGSLLMTIALGDLILKPMVSPAFDRFGFRRTVLWASAAGLVGLVAIALAAGGAGLVPLLVVALLVSGISRSLVFSGIAAQSFTVLHEAHINSGNVVASISQQLANAVAVLLSAILLAVSAQVGGRVEPGLMDFRLSLLVIAGIGLFATLRLRHFLPDHLRDARTQGPVKLAAAGEIDMQE